MNATTSGSPREASPHTHSPRPGTSTRAPSPDMTRRRSQAQRGCTPGGRTARGCAWQSPARPSAVGDSRSVAAAASAQLGRLYGAQHHSKGSVVRPRLPKAGTACWAAGGSWSPPPQCGSGGSPSRPAFAMPVTACQTGAESRPGPRCALSAAPSCWPVSAAAARHPPTASSKRPSHVVSRRHQPATRFAAAALSERPRASFWLGGCRVIRVAWLPVRRGDAVASRLAGGQAAIRIFGSAAALCAEPRRRVAPWAPIRCPSCPSAACTRTPFRRVSCYGEGGWPAEVDCHFSLSVSACFWCCECSRLPAVCLPLLRAPLRMASSTR